MSLMRASTPFELRLVHADGSRSDAPLLVSPQQAAAYDQVLATLGARLELFGAPARRVESTGLVHTLGRLYAASDAEIDQELARLLPDEEPLLRRRAFDAVLSLLRAGADAHGVEIRPSAKRSSR